MEILVVLVLAALLVGYFAFPLLLERMGWIRLKEPPGGWPDRHRRERTADEVSRRDQTRGGGGSFGGGGASGGW